MPIVGMKTTKSTPHEQRRSCNGSSATSVVAVPMVWWKLSALGQGRLPDASATAAEA